MIKKGKHIVKVFIGLLEGLTKYKKMNAFIQHLEQHLTVSQFQGLHKELGVTQVLLTRYLRNPGLFEKEHIEIIANILKADPLDLIFKFRLGFSKITAEQLDRIAREQGLELDVTMKAA